MTQRGRGMTLGLGASSGAAVALVVGFAALFSITGADARWLGALGAEIVHSGGIPHGVPFAAAASGSWPNVPALAEVVFHGLLAAGPRALLAAQLAAVAVALVTVARDGRAAGASDGAIALCLIVASVGAFPSLAVVRVQLFSVALFPLLLALLRAEARAESRRIWLVVPLLALWSNLHGAVLAGLGVLLVYLALDRARRAPLEAAVVAVAAVAACCLTPALERTPRYFYGVLENDAARRGVGLWAPLSPTRPFDVILAAAAVLLLVPAVRSRPRRWELAALLALAAMTIHATRSGIWLLLAAAPLAAGALGGVREAAPRLTRTALFVGLGVIVLGLGRGPTSNGATPRVLDRALAVAAGRPILAPDLIAEQVALRGGRIEIGNPIDAFPLRDQAAYLDWAAGRAAGDGELDSAHVVLVRSDSAAERRIARDARFARVASDANAVLFTRREAADAG